MTSPDAKKLKDAKAHDNANNEDDSHDELMEKESDANRMAWKPPSVKANQISYI